MYKKDSCTCRAVVLLKITIFLTLSLSCRGGGCSSSLLLVAGPEEPPPAEGLDLPLITVSSQVVQGPNYKKVLFHNTRPFLRNKHI